MPGSPGSSWAIYKARLISLVRNPEAAVLVAFWLFGEEPLPFTIYTLNIVYQLLTTLHTCFQA